MFNFVFDHSIDNLPYPNLASAGYNSSNDFAGIGDVYPFISPLRLLYFIKDHNYPVNISYINDPIPTNAFYPVGLGFFNYDFDYFNMLSNRVKDLCREDRLKILFYYHEGDNPYFEKDRLDQLCIDNELPVNCYRFISGNTAAKNVPNFFYFPDHELFYWRNSVMWNGQSMPGCSYHTRRRSQQYTVLSRVHKWWRATVVSELQHLGLINNSYMSYNTEVSHGDQFTDNPIRVRALNIIDRVNQFVERGPYRADNMTEKEHNSHWMLVTEHFDNAYCNLVLETLYDAEQSLGAFISEKIFKPIRHAQPFIVFGTPHTLKLLNDLGYRTFDKLLDNSYDNEFDNTQRFVKTLKTVEQLHKTDLHDFYIAAKDDMLHNQELFLSSKYDRLDILANDLNASYKL
jgi:hypothetical protein